MLMADELEEVEQCCNRYDDYDPASCIAISADYKSTDKYSKETVVASITRATHAFPSGVVETISEFAEGRIIRCAEPACGQEFSICCDADIEDIHANDDEGRYQYTDESKSEHLFSLVLKDEQIDALREEHGDDACIELTQQMRDRLRVGNHYNVLCQACRKQKYCAGSECCHKKIVRYDEAKGAEVRVRGSKVCEDCKGVFCQGCASHWEDWGFADASTTCSTCGWVIKKKALGHHRPRK